MINTGNELIIKGDSGKEYKFNVYTISNFDDIDFDADGGVYLFTRRYKDANGKIRHSKIYCGKTADLSSRFNNHHKEKEIMEHTLIVSVLKWCPQKMNVIISKGIFLMGIISLAMNNLIRNL